MFFGKKLQKVINDNKFTDVNTINNYYMQSSLYYTLINNLNDIYDKCIYLRNNPHISSNEQRIIEHLCSIFSSLKTYKINYNNVSLSTDRYIPNIIIYDGEIFGGEIILPGSVFQRYIDIYEEIKNIEDVNKFKFKENNINNWEIKNIFEGGFLHKGDGIKVDNLADYLCSNCHKSASTNKKRNDFYKLSKCDCGCDTYFKIKIPNEMYLLNNNNI
jgi:hypothetical protein